MGIARSGFGELLTLIARRAAAGHLSVGRQLCEMAYLRLVHDIGLSYYQAGGFWRTSMPWRDKVDHLGSRRYLRAVGRLNAHPYQKLSQNKLAEKSILETFAIPTPDFFGVFHPLWGRTRQGAPLTRPEHLLALLRELGPRRICFKELEGWGGRNFLPADMEAGSDGVGLRVDELSGVVPFEDFFARRLRQRQDQGILIEDYIDQHEVYRSFNPTSVNTMRIWVLRDEDSFPETIGGYLRIGRKDSVVDNQSSGGIVAPIALASGELGAANDGVVTRESFPRHPDNGCEIEGRILPLWAEARRLAEEALSIFPNIRFAGADIAVARDGPVVLELNVCPDKEGAAYMDLPAKRYLERGEGKSG